MNNYSPNMLKTFEQCQEKFFLKYVQKVSIPQRSELFVKGKKIHALANYYLQGADVSKMEQVLNSQEKAVWESLKASKYFKLEVINTEYNLSCKVGKYWVGGRLDALMADGKDYFILDYKTGNIPQNVQDDLQTIVYLLSADKYLAKKGGYNSLRFVYLGLKKTSAPHPNQPLENRYSIDSLGTVPQGGREQPSEKEILLTSDLKKQYEQKIISLCEKIDFALTSNIFNKQQEACKCCEYRKICQGK